MLQSVDCCVVTLISFDIIYIMMLLWASFRHCLLERGKSLLSIYMSLNDDDDGDDDNDEEEEEVLNLVL